MPPPTIATLVAAAISARLLDRTKLRIGLHVGSGLTEHPGQRRAQPFRQQWIASALGFNDSRLQSRGCRQLGGAEYRLRRAKRPAPIGFDRYAEKRLRRGINRAIIVG